jgi:hypothetical protein
MRLRAWTWALSGRRRRSSGGARAACDGELLLDAVLRAAPQGSGATAACRRRRRVSALGRARPLLSDLGGSPFHCPPTAGRGPKPRCPDPAGDRGGLSLRAVSGPRRKDLEKGAGCCSCPPPARPPSRPLSRGKEPREASVISRRHRALAH